MEEIVHWGLPIENKRPIFKNVHPAGIIKIREGFARSGLL